MTPIDAALLARVTARAHPALHATRGTAWGDEAWRDVTDGAVGVLEAYLALTGASAAEALPTRSEVLTEAAQLLDAEGHHAGADCLREHAGLGGGDVEELLEPQPVRDIPQTTDRTDRVTHLADRRRPR